MSEYEYATSQVAMRVIDASKRYGSTQALNGVSFELLRGSVHALLGGNGSGKSTMIKMLAGVVAADCGRLEFEDGQALDLRGMTPRHAKAAGLHFVHQQRTTFPELSVAENLAIGRGFETGSAGRIRWRETRRLAARALERFHIDAKPDTELATLGPATQKMIAIARALQDQKDAEDGILILDEPTAALPDSEVTLLLAALRRYAEHGQTIVYVTHRLDEVFAIADRATLLRDGELVDTVATQDLSHDGLVELIVGRPSEQIATVRDRPAGPELLELSKFTAARVGPLDLKVRAGEVVGVAGLIGSGRSSLLKALFGVIPIESGGVRLGGSDVAVDGPAAAMAAGFAYVPEDRAAECSFGELTLRENLSITNLDRYWRAGRLDQRMERRDAQALLQAFQIKAASVDAPLSSLSGGNEQKAILARWLQRNPRVLLLDEPSQGVDVGARAEIHQLVRRAVAGGTAAIWVSSDFEELAAVCDRAVVMRNGCLLGELSGDRLDSGELQRLAHAEAAA